MVKNLKIFAHRGASENYPENTLLAFKKAVELGVDGIELDVHLTKDKKLVVIHDETTKRTSDKEWKICERTLDELKTVDVGRWKSFYGEKIPTFDEVLEIAGSKTVVNVEIKNGPVFYRGIEEEVIKTLKKQGRLESTIISSFDHFSVRRVKKLEGRSRVGVLFSLRSPYISYIAKKVSAEFINIHKNYVVRNDILKLTKKGFKIMVWEVSSLKEAEWLADASVWGIFTNNPALFSKKVKRLL